MIAPPASRSPASRHTPLFFLLLVLIGCALLMVLGCSPEKKNEGKSGQKKKSAAPVTIETSQTRTLPVELGAIGHVEAFASVEIRSQVTGSLKSVHFKEGDEVKAGQLLFSLDPRPFAANLARMEAELARDKAELDNARRASERYALAAQKGYVSAEQADQAATKVATLSATVRGDQAAVDVARLELDYCTIRAPLAGRTGEINTDPGNLIKANADNPMVTIKQMQPILTTFTVPGQHLPDIEKYRAAGTLKVLAAIKDTGAEMLADSLSFIDNTVDPATGVIRLKASFANTDQALWPGRLVDVRIRLTTLPDCVAVPSQAIQIGQQGPYVYVVKADQTIEYRPVTPGMLYQGETAIKAGLQAGERVVTDGQLQLTDGIKVEERKGLDPGKGGESGNNSARTSR